MFIIVLFPSKLHSTRIQVGIPVKKMKNKKIYSLIISSVLTGVLLAAMAFCYTTAAASNPSADKIVQQWRARSRFLSLGKTDEADAYLKKIETLKTKSSIPNLSPISAALSLEASSTDTNERDKLLLISSDLSPEDALPYAYIAKNALSLSDFSPTKAARALVSYTKILKSDSFQGAPVLYDLNLTLKKIIRIFALIFLSLLFIRRLPLIFFRIKRIFEPSVPAGLAAAAIASTFVPAWLIAGKTGIFLLLCLYLWPCSNKREQLITALILVCLALSVPLDIIVKEASQMNRLNPIYPTYKVEREIQMGSKSWEMNIVKKSAENGDLLANLVLGLVAKRSGRLEEALQYFEKADSNNISPLASVNKAIVLKRRGEDAKAITVLKKAVLKAPDMFSAHYNLGRILAQNAMLDEARPHLRKAQGINPHLFSMLESKKTNKAQNLSLAEARPKPPAIDHIISTALSKYKTEWIKPSVTYLIWIVLCMLFSLTVGGKKKPLYCRNCGKPFDPLETEGESPQGMCIQCINTFYKKTAVEPSARALKEKQVSRYNFISSTLCKLIGIPISGFAQLAHGAALLGSIQMLSLVSIAVLFAHPSMSTLTRWEYPDPIIAIARVVTIATFLILYAVNIIWIFKGDEIK